VLRWTGDDLLQLKREEIGEYYGRYRLYVPEAERAMARSLQRYGQLSPVVVCRRQERYELIDGFKRLGAMRSPAGIEHLSARLMEADERSAKAAITVLTVPVAAPANWKKHGSFMLWCVKTA
jgi:ParB-like chromosome segregation protein Spo0J